MIEVIETIRSLGFGAMLGAGLAGLAHILFPDTIGKSEFENVLTAGALVGAGGHRLIDLWIINGILSPCGRFFSYYSKLVQLSFLRRVIGHKRAKQILRSLTDWYFLPGNLISRPPERKARPPAHKSLPDKPKALPDRRDEIADEPDKERRKDIEL